MNIQLRICHFSLNRSQCYNENTQGIIAASISCHTDELTLPNRYIAALKSFSSSHNIIISHSDKGRGVYVMDSSVSNQKLKDLLDDHNTYKLF